MSPAEELYDRDFYEWALSNAALLRSGRLGEADVAHIAEELEDMGKSQRREIESRLTVLLSHLVKFYMQPERRSRSWHGTITTQRQELQLLFEDNPSLRRRAAESVRRVYPGAVRVAAVETGIRRELFPAECPFTVEQVLDPDYLPTTRRDS